MNKEEEKEAGRMNALLTETIIHRQPGYKIKEIRILWEKEGEDNE